MPRPTPLGATHARGVVAPPRIDHARIEAAVREILVAVGEDPDREGLLDTPARVARAYGELFAGLHEDAGAHLARQFDHEHDGDDAVVLRNIEFSSTCEHHLQPFLGRAHVAYLPSEGRVTGLSKLARTVDVFARRPQLQERLTSQIADAIALHLDARGVAVLVEGEHLCMRSRGARKRDAVMVTTAFRGAYRHDRGLRREVLALLRGRGA
ncbi:MAG: GTP cyclohydrolase I FolE [Deltaproteobacteria bacterium]|nr:GTP cyclohydrolase I FolE [Deltaproteobacteria bacterium]